MDTTVRFSCLCKLTSVSNALRTTYRETENTNLQSILWTAYATHDMCLTVPVVTYGIVKITDLSPLFVCRIFIEVTILKLLFDNEASYVCCFC